MIPISGFLKNYSLSNIFLDLQRSKNTGILEIRNGPISKKIYVKNGDIVFATSNQEEDSLGEILLKAGRITTDQYYQSIDMMEKTGKLQGAVLVELGYLRPKEIIWATRYQVEEIIMNLFQWEDGEFVFIEGTHPPEEVIPLKLDATNLIYRGIKRINNPTYIKDVWPPMDTILRYRTDPTNLFQDIIFEETDKAILSLINGRRNIKEILSISPLDDFQTMKILYAFLSTGMIETIEEKETGEGVAEIPARETIKEPETEIPQEVIGKIEDIYSKYESIGYYGILGIKESATQDEIKKAFYRAAKEFHPDEHFYLKSDDLKNKLNKIFSFITQAYKTLSDPEKKMEYDRHLSIKSERAISKKERAKAKFEEAVTEFKKNNIAKAAELFNQAAYLDSSVARYHYYCGLVLNRLGRFKEAGRAIQRALEIAPSNADYMAELGHIYLQLGFKLRAKSTFEKAIRFDPSNEKAVSGLQKIRDHS